MLFEEIKIRNTTLKNRIVIPPMVITHSDENGLMTQEDLEHYRRMGHSGAAMVIQEATCVSDHAKLCTTQFGLWNDSQIAGMRAVAKAIHDGGAVAVVQIHHAGAKSMGNRIEAPFDFDMELWGNHIAGKTMSQEDALRIRDEFVAAGRRAMLAGYDGVELHAAHGYLLSQMMNPLVNKMTGSLGENPCDYVRSIMDGIREVTSDDFIVGIRLGGMEPTLDDGMSHVQMLRGHADYFHVSYGESTGTVPVIPEEYKELGQTAFAAMKIKQMLMREQDETPVIAVVGMSAPGRAQKILQETGVDLIAVGRGHLVNPNWTNDLKNGLYPGQCYLCKSCKVRQGICPGQIKLKEYKEEKKL